MAPVHLNTILELLLNYLISLNVSHEGAPVDDLVSALADEHEIPRDVSDQVMSWFGHVEEGTWKMDVDAVVAEIGIGILRHYKVAFGSFIIPARPPADHAKKIKHEPILETEFITRWKRAIGDAFESIVSLRLLLVRPLPTFSGGLTPDTHTTTGQLPPNPQQHFGHHSQLPSRFCPPNRSSCALCRVVPDTPTMEER